MTTESQVVFKDRDRARVERRSEPPEYTLRLYEDATAEQLALGAPYSELSRVADVVVKTVAESVTVVLAEVCTDTDEKIAALEKRLVMTELEIGALRSENASLKRSIDMLDRRLTFTFERHAASVARSRPKGGRAKKAPGNGHDLPSGSPDAAQLPASIIRRAAE
jgi:hypothetical protein